MQSWVLSKQLLENQMVNYQLYLIIEKVESRQDSNVNLTILSNIVLFVDHSQI